jgi:hypothetical protein
MGGTQEERIFNAPIGGNPSTNFTSTDGRPVFVAIGDDGLPVIGPDGANIYIDVEGRQVEVKAIDRSQPQAAADTAPTTPAQTPSPAPTTPEQTPSPAPAAPQGTGTGELPQANIQRNDTPPQPDVVPAPKQGIDPKMVDIVSGNNAVGIKLRAKGTGEELPGKYKVVNGRYVRIDEVGA